MMGVLEYVGAWAIHRIPLIGLELGVFALLITVLLRLKFLRPARIRKWFWLLVLAKPLAMLVVISPLALNVSVFQDVNSLPQVAPDSALSQTSVDVSGEFPPPDRRGSIPDTDMVSQSPSFWSMVRGLLNWSRVIALLWICGTVFLCGRALMGLRRLGKLRDQAVPLDYLHDILAPLGSSLGIRGLPEVRASKEISSPLLFGLLHPVILLPSGLCERLSLGALRLTLLHELFHWKHRDTWILLLGRLVEAFFFFHPAVWYAGRMAVRASEEACDDAVVSLTGNSAGYASCLLSISEGAGIQRRYALAGLAAKDSAVGKRIRRILRESVPVISRKAVILSVSLLVMVSVLGLPALLASRSGAEASRLASDGGWIVFVRNGIWVMDAEGKNERQLTNDSTDGSPAWSPDGQQIAFTRDTGGYVCVMNADGSNLRQITDGPLDQLPHWLPDGKRIGFTREAWEKEDGQWIQEQGAIYLIDASGENPEQLTESPPFFGRDAEWSPDGSAIIYYQLNLDAPNQIWIMDSNGQNRKMLYRWGHHPAWSPDGKKIAFGSEEAGWNIGRTYDIYVMDADGANVKTLNKPGASTEDQPTWSPDGAKIAFVSDRDGNWDLYVMDSDGQNIRRLTNTPAVETSPDWTAFSYAVKPAGKLRKAWGWIKAK